MTALEDTPLTEILASVGITHKPGAEGHIYHRLFAPDGSFIGWYSADSAWKCFDELKAIAKERPSISAKAVA